MFLRYGNIFFVINFIF